MNRKTYVIYYEWPNTANNHAGMAYLFRTLKMHNKKEMQLIRIPGRINEWGRYMQKVYRYFLVFALRLLTTSSDKILFVEYLGNRSGNQTEIAKKLIEYGVKAKLYGIVHLSASHLRELYGNDDYVKTGLSQLEKVIVLGSSLQGYFISLGFQSKVICTFHYVDTNYYKPAESKANNSRLRVIAMGSLKRNHNALREIIASSPEVDFDVCMGNTNLENVFNDLQNVILHGFLAEDELLKLMQQADISISVIDDTIGSNVITTSLACGLPQIVSNVGSIKDYCNESNSILCESNFEFVAAIEKLKNDVELRQEMSKFSTEKSKDFDILNFNSWFVNNILVS
ncbi:MAG: glycosyltransferase [Paludibacter sp.]|nr:glycosyltransferase [Paludibacter sp.]